MPRVVIKNISELSPNIFYGVRKKCKLQPIACVILAYSYSIITYAYICCYVHSIKKELLPEQLKVFFNHYACSISELFFLSAMHCAAAAAPMNAFVPAMIFNDL